VIGSETSTEERAGEPEPHATGGGNLREIILGAQDNLTNTLGVVLGVAIGSGNIHTVALAGLAAGITQSLSMGAVVYTSTRAERDLYDHALEQERREVHEVPDIERQEIRDIYRSRGFEGELLEQIVDVVTSDEDRWVQQMMTDELGLPPEPPKPALMAAVVTYVAGLIAALIPLVPFALMSLRAATIGCGVISVLVLFGLGSWKGRITGRAWWRDGLQFALIATAAASAAGVVGAILKVNPSG